MPNHWHLVLRPRGDGDLSQFMRWLTVTHTQRWHAHHHTAGTGPVYQGRFKSFPVGRDEYFLTLCRYVERNALRANLVDRAEQWRWCSMWHRKRGSGVVYAKHSSGRSGKQLPTPFSGALVVGRDVPPLSDWPVARPRNWVAYVNRVETADELEKVRKSLSTWVLPASMDTAIVTLLRYYYLSIGFPPDQWQLPVKCDENELKEIIKTIHKNICGGKEHVKGGK